MITQVFKLINRKRHKRKINRITINLSSFVMKNLITDNKHINISSIASGLSPIKNWFNNWL